MTDFIAAAENELSAVRDELAALTLKFNRLSEIVALYKGGAVQTAPTPPASRFSLTSGHRPIPRKKHTPQRDLILALAAEAIKGRMEPTKTSDIYDIIVPLGAEIGGTSPKGNLSAILWKSELFHSHGRSGWTLAEYGVGDEPDPSDRASPEPSGNVTPEIDDDLKEIIG